MFQKLPGDSWFENLDPLIKAYMFEHWLEDENEKKEHGRMVAILTGSFTNPEAAQNMLKSDNPDFTSTDEDFEKSLELVQQDKTRYLLDKKKARRRLRRLQFDGINKVDT